MILHKITIPPIPLERARRVSRIRKSAKSLLTILKARILALGGQFFLTEDLYDWLRGNPPGALSDAMAPVGEEEDEDSLYGKPQVLSTLILCSTPMLIQSNIPYSKCHRDVPEKYQYLDIYPKIRERSNLRCVTRTQSITEPKPKFFSPIPEPEPYPAPSWKLYHATPSHPPNHLHPSETYSRA